MAGSPRLSPLGVTLSAVVVLGMLYLLLTRGAHDTARLVDLRQVLALSVEAAVLGGQQVRNVKESGDLKGRVKGHTKEGVDEPLTLGDIMSHRAMLGLFHNTFPYLKVISEEHDNSDLKLIPWSGQIPQDMLKQLPDALLVPARDITIWLDPLDATKEFTEDLVQYVTTMVCVAVKGHPLIGVIHKPFTHLTAWGFANHGLSANLKRRNVDPSKLSFIMSRSHSGIVKDLTQQVFGTNVSIVSAGGAGFKALSLIDVENDKSDKADVYIHTTLIKKWDICAGNAILEAIGGNMTTLTGVKMLSILGILLLALLFSLISLWRDRHPIWLHSSSSAPLPPSLPWLPILGSLLSLPRGPPHLALTRLAHAHGPVLGLWLGSHRAVVVSRAQEVHEVLIGQGRVFGGRPPMVTTDILTRGGQDIAFANYGPAWRLHRKIVHASLYKGGFGMEEIEAIVSAEAKELCAGLFGYCNGQSLDLTTELTCAVTNIICALTFSSGYSRTDPEFVSMLRWNEGIVRTVARDAPVDIFPWLRFLPLADLRSLRACVQERDSVLLSKMKQRQACLEEGSPPQDVLGCLLAAQHAARGDLRARHLTDTHLLMTVGDIFGAGVETTSTVLRWIIAYLVTYPKIQAAIQAQLDVMLEGAFPCLADQVRLPLLQATIWEVLRSRPVSPIFIPHVALKNTTLGGFHIARGTRVLVNLYAVHHDPTVWDDPEQFQPGRFLSSDGLQVTPPRPHFLPFGAGPRGCLGEALAKAEIFLLMASLLQTFTLSLPPQCPAPNLEGVHGVVLRPPPFKVCLKHRSTCA